MSGICNSLIFYIYVTFLYLFDKLHYNGNLLSELLIYDCTTYY
jgi:hypothetical protein